MKTLPNLIENNRKWAAKVRAEKPNFFAELAEIQSPKHLWIGCADSRVPANQITGLAPGELFVHRNIANLVVHSDLNMLSVLQYAVEILKVQHVIVCGHYGCGGVRAAINSQPNGLVDNWLRHIEDIAVINWSHLKALDYEARLDRLCELNVIQQANNLGRTTVIQEAWNRGQKLEIHSWIYSLKDGHICDLQDPIDHCTEQLQ
ncbi:MULTISPECIES: carbonate dehydratase [unclassified Lentimonas]|uniref:carbonate dehydratase n=1 Tax=unclassified Lentimonas TaxID=2630993 RepID=UPI001326F835|nr:MULTISPECIES: carbonate dehydratase [unclassified Lentimonas]CAA6676699.1 Carbonic anhydrase (EC [Lentimonas sp. CC4]CAA6684636.1 Carbonic anhydrase (EC [Lentimonas sp. CC6]CAA6694202.1 Carbonic anhydrase (EC [Lentimonas sp. CC19]CAA6694302.1 Carbonic anhydrase (EC [Lentimonas sp. CC10]CAA7070394.1 Carbonic anhydrase (EC [Lentimonas sp. CC11]